MLTESVKLLDAQNTWHSMMKRLKTILNIICKWFEIYYKSLYTETIANPLNFMNTLIVKISNINVTDSEVALALLSLKSNARS